MNKREKIERAREIQEEMLLFTEMPHESREFMKQNIKVKNPAAAVDEYHYLRITIDDMDTGQPFIVPIFTYRKPTDLEAVGNAIIHIATWPDELLAGIVWAEFVFAGADRLRGPSTGLKLQKRQMLGGRRKQNAPTSEKSAYYLSIANWFYRSGLSQCKFCDESGVKLSTLHRALTYAKSVKQR